MPLLSKKGLARKSKKIKQQNLLFHVYVILFFALLIPPLAGMGTGRLLYWAVFEREEKRKAGGGTGGEK